VQALGIYGSACPPSKSQYEVHASTTCAFRYNVTLSCADSSRILEDCSMPQPRQVGNRIAGANAHFRGISGRNATMLPLYRSHSP
jgi:hypothetical protein